MNKAGELFAECRRKYGLEPSEVLGLLCYTPCDCQPSGDDPQHAAWCANPKSDLFEVREGDDYQGHLGRIERHLALTSSRVLRPEVGKAALEVELDRAERLALEAAAAMRFPEFGHWAGVWASINTAIGRPYRTSPFSRFASLAREMLE